MSSIYNMINSFFKSMQKLVQRLHTLLGLVIIAWFAGEWIYNDRVADAVVMGMKAIGLPTSEYIRGVLPVSETHLLNTLQGLFVVLLCIFVSHCIFHYLLGSFISDDS